MNMFFIYSYFFVDIYIVFFINVSFWLVMEMVGIVFIVIIFVFVVLKDLMRVSRVVWIEIRDI